MREGFSLLELIVALLVLEVGVLAAAGTILLAQRNMSRAEMILRGALEAEWVGDSLSGVEEAKSGGPGSRTYPWGFVDWEGADLGIGGLRLVATRESRRDTLAVVLRWPALPAAHVVGPEGGQ